MINTIYILTCKRVDNQITYNQLPDELKDRVVMVVQEWERDQYNYPCDYMVLPNYISVDNPRAITLTRDYVYRMTEDKRFCIFDDDLIFKRRNAKYWTGKSNMEKSSRICSADDIREMFALYESWMDEDIAFCSCGQTNNPPGNKAYSDNSSMTSAYWIDGAKIQDVIQSTDFAPEGLTCGQDVFFILTLLTNGKRNRISNEFVLDNRSYNTKSLKSDLWDSLKRDLVTKSHQTIQATFPDLYEILYDTDSVNREGGFRGYGKTRIKWSKAYKMWEEKNCAKLDSFFG
jgi:hypothetical protein